MIKQYIKSCFSPKKLEKTISLLSFWDDNCSFSNKILIGAFTRIHKSKIGDYTRIKPLCSIFNANIGKYCSIAKGVKIGLGRHPVNLISTNSIFYKSGIRDDWWRKLNFDEELPVEIGNDVWIGLESTILDGVKIGDGAIIAAKSVVTKDVPPYAIVGGIPARIIKFRFNKDIIEKLLELRWWDYSDIEIYDNINLFTNDSLTVGLLESYICKKNAT